MSNEYTERGSGANRRPKFTFGEKVWVCIAAGLSSAAVGATTHLFAHPEIVQDQERFRSYATELGVRATQCEEIGNSSLPEPVTIGDLTTEQTSVCWPDDFDLGMEAGNSDEPINFQAAVAALSEKSTEYENDTLSFWEKADYYAKNLPKAIISTLSLMLVMHLFLAYRKNK